MFLELKLTVLSGGDLRSDFNENFLEIKCVQGKKNYKPCRTHARKTITEMHQGNHFRLIPFYKNQYIPGTHFLDSNE